MNEKPDQSESVAASSSPVVSAPSSKELWRCVVTWVSNHRMVVCASAIVALVPLVVFIFASVARRGHLDGMSALEEYLRAHGNWSIVKPPNDFWEPGMVLIEEDGVLYAINIDENPSSSGGQFPRRRSNLSLPIVDLVLSGADAATGKFLTGKITSIWNREEDATLRITPGAAHEQSISIESALAIGEKEALQKHLENPNRRVYVLTHTLVVESLHLEVLRDSGLSGESGFEDSADEALQKIATEVRSSFSAESRYELTIDSPRAIGFRAREVVVTSGTLGSGTGVIDTREVDFTRLEVLGIADEVEQTSMPHVHALCIGLSEYVPHRDGLVGGTLPGSYASAQLLADNLRRLTIHDPISSVMVYPPTNEPSRLNRISRDDLRSAILSWIEQTKRAIKERASSEHKEGVQDICVVYFCGHGTSSSVDKGVILLPEDFQERLHEGVPSDERESLTLEEYLRAADGAGTLSKDAGLPVSEITNMLDDFHSELPSVCTVVLADCCRITDERREVINQLFDIEIARPPRDPNVPIPNPTASISQTLTESVIGMERDFGPAFSFLRKFSRTHTVYAVSHQMSASVVPYEVNGTILGIGPLSAALDSLFQEFAMNQYEATMFDLVRALQLGVRVGETEVRGYYEDVKVDGNSKIDDLKSLPFLRNRESE